jgi:RNA polymerase sigma-70 factor (ECF subfamily)
MTYIDEHLLLQQLREGQEQAYRSLFDNHYAVLCHVAEEYVHDEFLAETIVCDIFFHLWEIRESVEITTSLRCYLLQSVRNRCKNYLHSSHAVHEQPVSYTANFPVERYIESDDYPLGRLLQDELEEQINQAIDRLPANTRNVFMLSRFENKTMEQIAKDMNLSVNTVKYHIKQALRLIHKDLHDYLVTLFFLMIVS